MDFMFRAYQVLQDSVSYTVKTLNMKKTTPLLILSSLVVPCLPFDRKTASRRTADFDLCDENCILPDFRAWDKLAFHLKGPLPQHSLRTVLLFKLRTKKAVEF